MQPSQNISRLSLFVFALAGLAVAKPLAAPSTAGATTIVADEPEPAPYLVSHEQMLHWIANTDAKLTFIGKPINPLAPRSAQDTMVIYCSHAAGSVCGSPCTVYNGGSTCLNAPGTNCLSATNDVGFCDRAGCTHSCHSYNSCGTRMDNGFCFTPGTQSILVSTN